MKNIFFILLLCCAIVFPARTQSYITPSSPQNDHAPTPPPNKTSTGAKKPTKTNPLSKNTPTPQQANAPQVPTHVGEDFGGMPSSPQKVSVPQEQSAQTAGPLYDITGTWVCAGAYKAEWFQEGQHVYSIYNVGHLKHYLSGRFVSANQIEAQVVRIDVNNGCRTTLTFRYTVTDNTLTGSWTANDGNCDLQRGQTGDETITRTTATPRPLNTFGGTAFNPANDVTGSWSWEDDWLQDGQNVYYIANGNGYKQFFRGTRNGNQIRGELIRFNPSGCRMILKQTFIQADANTMQYNWIGMGNCDITNGQTESGTIVRKK